jgi:heptosyltransferase III
MKLNKTALFLKTKHLGDSIILTSAISALPQDFVVDVLCFKESAPIFAMNPRVRHVLTVPRHLNGFARWGEYWRLLSVMRRQQYDVLAQFSDDWRGAFLARLLNAKVSVARQAKKRPTFWSNSFHQIAKLTPTSRPAAEQDVDVLRKIGLYSEPFAPAYQLHVAEADKQYVENWLKFEGLTSQATAQKKLIVMHAAARWKFKGLPYNTWAALIDSLHQRGYFVVLSGAPSDLAFNQALVALCQKAPYLTQDFDLGKTAALMQSAHLIVSIDSMAIHMASALQTPVVAMFGPTDERIWAPWRVSHRVVVLGASHSPSFACRPCGLDGCAGSKISQCLHAITGTQILAAIDELL